jgi:hypothetical protein
MTNFSKRILCVAAAAFLLFAGAQTGYGQNITSGTLTGTVTDAQKGVLPGATVIATHTPTGTTYEAVTGADGRFIMNSVRIGGPYTIKITMSGFKEETKTGIEVGLGEAREVSFTLGLATVTETVNVVAEAQIIDTSRAGTASNIGAQALETLPTMNRSLNDFARTSPYFNVTAASAGDPEMVSVAGRNNRYNNMQIDGAVNNDVFGLSATGTPGGQTGTQPVSLDAIQEIQLLVSPYDVRQGGFSGGGVNAVTKSGTNKFSGGAYYVGRNQGLVGAIPAVKTLGNQNPADTKVGPFTDKQTGFSVGGPIQRNKMFFFTNLDWARKNTPSGYSADGSSGQQFSQQAYVQQVADIAKSKYGYDPGALSEFSKPNNSNKFFGRVDFNIKSKHQLTVRENYVDALADIGTNYSYRFNFPSNFYHMTDKMLSSVVQMNSSFGSYFNEFRLTYQRERNIRGGQPGDALFPEVRVTLPDTNDVYLGTEYSSHANKLNQDIVQLSDDVTFVKGTHTLTFGTQNEFYKFYNLFIQYLYGGYRFSTIANFNSGIAQSYNHNYSNTSDPNQATEFSVMQFGFYAGDKWRAKPNFTLTYGARIDMPYFPDKPKDNPIAMTDFGYSTTTVPNATMFSPRVGFNWDLSNGASGKRRQIRGGIGQFVGRTPYVWISNQYGNTGLDFTNLSVSYNVNNKIPFVADPLNQPTTVTGGATGRQTINLVTEDYKFPTVVRGNIALDHDLGFFGLVGTAELLYTKNLKEIFYSNINYVPSGTTLPDGRVVTKKYDSNLNDVVLLSNTAKGKSWTTSFAVERPFRNGFFFKASYLYGQSFSVNDGVSSVARSNWSGNPYQLYVNDPQMSRSNYDPGHRINFAATVQLPKTWKLSHQVSVFYNGMTGRRYSLGFNGDLNGDGVSNNELLFVPASASDVVVYNGTWEQLDAYISQDPGASQYRGKIMPRAGARAPWQNQMDLQYSLNIPTGGKTKVELTATVINFLNLLNGNWGWQYWAPFPGMGTAIGYGGVCTGTTGSSNLGCTANDLGKMRYNLANITSSTFSGTFTRDDLRSRWQAQFGARFRF